MGRKWKRASEFPAEDKKIGNALFSVEVLGFDGFRYFKAYYNFTQKVWLDGNSEEACETITHWMPLPVPPGQQECQKDNEPSGAIF